MDRRTPEGIPLSLIPAGPGPRLWAWAVDAGVCGVLFLLAILVVGGAGAVGGGLLLLFLFALWWGYPVVLEALHGRTLGKRLLHLRVLRLDGLPIGWREAFLRGILQAADFLPFGFATGLVCMLFSRGFRRLGDFAAGTVVVHDDPVPEPRPLGLPAPAAPPFPLLPGEQRALIDLAERFEHIPVERRVELGDIAFPLTGLRGDVSAERLRAIAAGFLS